MTRNTFDLLAEPVGELYYGLLDFGLTECTKALLVVAFGTRLELCGWLLRELEPFVNEAKQTSEWPGTKSSDPATVLYYDYGPACAEVLKRAATGLYDWNGWRLPNDLCLLRDDESPWLITIGHEHDGYLSLSPEEKARLAVGFPPIAPYLRDSRDRRLTHDQEMEIGSLLIASGPYADHSDPFGDVPQESQAIYFALSTGQVKAQRELAQYIADMQNRWDSDSPPPGVEEFTGVAETIWAWWEKEIEDREIGNEK